MRKGLLTLDDLFNYYSHKNESIKFSSNDSNQNIFVQLPADIKYQKSNENLDGLFPVTIQACHTDKNRNGSSISKKVMNKCLSSFSNRPILAYIHKVDDQEEFGWHALHTEDGEIVYDEIPVGTVPESNNAKLVYNKNKDRYDVMVDGYIYEEYSNAKDILERMGEASVSVELGIKELSFDSKENVLNIEDFYFSGVTILGKDEDGNDVLPGMEGSNITLADFSENNNSLVNNQKLIEELKRLNNNLEAFNIDNIIRKEENAMNKFEELLEKYNVTVDDVTFEYEGMSNEDLEAKFEEMFGQSEETDESIQNEEFEEDTEETEEDDSEETSEENDDEEENEDFSIKYSVTRKGETFDFEVSMSQIISGLSDLVNATYSETDNTWYSVDVYEESKTVVMVDYWYGGKAYRQNYKVRNGQYTLVGDRVEVFSQWLTSDEIAELDKIKSNYSVVSNKLKKYEDAEAMVQKENIIKGITDDKRYSELIKDEEFKALEAGYAEFSVDEVQKKCDEIILKYIKNGGTINYSINDDSSTKPTVIPVPNVSPRKRGRYGGLV